MEITIKAEAKEIAALVVTIQERQGRTTVADFEKKITESINHLAQDESHRLGLTPVSYTHLDVYKRQGLRGAGGRI